jgi:alkanesulfonate monooxygenase SsuD/methylene tetrahydromethanopterin reductase-like flavin-dependent oxidoreductase (luciferase family)
VRLGTHVTGAPFHHPTALARQVAAVDLLSGGRAVLGIGVAYEHADFEPYGFPELSFGERVSALDETLCILDLLWSGKSEAFVGDHFSLRGGACFEPKPLQQPRPPILVGLNRHGKALSVAAARADGINTWQLGAAQVAELRPRAEEAWERAGRDPATLKLTCDLLLARGADRAGAERLAGTLRDTARSWGRSPSVTDWDAGGILYGDADGIGEQLLRFAETGVTEIAVAIHDLDELTWFSDEVIAAWRRPDA